MKPLGAIDPEAVERACIRGRDSGEVSPGLCRERMKSASRIFIGGLFDDDIQALGFWRPDPEMGCAATNKFSPDGISP